MKKALLAVSLSITLAWGIGDVGKPNVFTPNTVAQSSQVNANFDSAFHSINRLKDSVEAKFIRFTDLTSGDSTLTRLQVDTIRGNPDVDTILGKPYIDSIVTGYILPTRIGAFTALNFTADTITCDSINNASGINTARLTASGNVQGDSIVSAKGARITNNALVGGTVLADSVKSTKGISATIGNFSGKVLGDSLVSTKGARITNLLFAGNIQSGDSIIGSGVRATNGINAASLTASGKIAGDSLVSSKGARITNALVAGGNVQGDSLVSAKGARITNRIVTSEIQVSDSLIAQNSARITSTGKIIGDSIVSLRGARITANIRSDASFYGDSVVCSEGARITNEITCATINSGLGSTEVPVYTTGTFACSLFDGATYKEQVTAKYTKIGTNVTVSIPAMVNTIATSIRIKGWPAAIFPNNYASAAIPVYLGGAPPVQMGVITITRVGGEVAYVVKYDGTEIISGGGNDVGFLYETHFSYKMP